MTTYESLSWERFGTAAEDLADAVIADDFAPDLILAVARGGLCLAGALAYALDVKNVHLAADTVDVSGARVLIADDVADTGETLRLVRDSCAQHVAEARCAVIYQKPHSAVDCEYVWRRTDCSNIYLPWSSL